MTAKPNIKHVARLANVSIATVSHVINETRYVSVKTKQKVLKAMEILNYEPNRLARGLRSQKTNTIGLIIPVNGPDTSSYFYMDISQGIESVLQQFGYSLIFCNSKENPSEETQLIRTLKSQQIEGIIIAPTNESHEDFKTILGDDFPTVFIDRAPINYESDCILIDTKSIVYEAIEHLIFKGHRKIGFISGYKTVAFNSGRIDGYKLALSEHGIEFNPSYIRYANSIDVNNGKLLLQSLLERTEITAVFVSNNILTLGAVSYIQQSGIRVPEDLAIIGFDDYDWMSVAAPPISTIRQPSYELGVKAATILMKRMTKTYQTFDKHLLPAELVIRTSC